MALLQKTGTYIATPVTWGIKHEEGKCPRFAMVFRANQIRNGVGWENVDGDQSITGFFTLINKDGSPNEINLRALNDSLGWDGANFASLEGGDWGSHEVQIVVGEHEYNGEVSLEVKYLNPKDYAGGRVQKADPQTVVSLDQKYGATLRALFNVRKGGNGSAAKAPAVTLPDTPDSAKQRAWQAFTLKTPDWVPAKRAEVFRKIVTECLPVGADAKACTSEQWTGIGDAIAKDFDPATEAMFPF